MGIERGAVEKRWACEKVAGARYSIDVTSILLPTPLVSAIAVLTSYVRHSQTYLPSGASHFSPVSVRDFSRKKVLSSTHHQHGSMVEKQEVV